MKQFEKELKKSYDYVGISFVIATSGKMEKMCRLVREISPESKIILGGYGTMLPECESLADYVCTEEGVGFMRRLLEESHNDEPKQHVEYSTSAKIAGFPLMKGAVVLAGLGCPHGCEFCATSHYHQTKHIPLLRTGTDLYREIKRVQGVLGGRNMPIGIIEEDFLMQHKRAAEYLECVRSDNHAPARISCFASAYSISQWDPDDLVRMGIEVVWIGVESQQAGYTKLQGLDIAGIIKSLHDRGINTLTSLIIGHDFHTESNIWEDFKYLVSLNPSLSQILILTPACGTPLFDRFNEAGRLLETPKKQWDGFHLVFDHPSISKPAMEKLILEFYDQEYRQLGPSAVRFIEKQLAGYLRFKDSPDQLLRTRAEQYRTGCIEALPMFPTAIRTAPTPDIARKVRGLQESLFAEVGRGGLKTVIQTFVVPFFARLEHIKLRRFKYSQVKMQRTEYRTSASLLHPFAIHDNLPLRVQPRLRSSLAHPLVVDLGGVFNTLTARKFKKRVQTYLAENSGTLAINFDGVTRADPKALCRFFKKIRRERDRIKIVSLDTLRADADEVIGCAKRYFEVFADIKTFAASLA
jgi:haloalkane dehalogenase